MNQTTTLESAAPTRTIGQAYIWLLTLFFGAHRFYVGKWLTACVYPVLLLAIFHLATSENSDYTSLAKYLLWFYLALLLVDACLIPRWVRQRNEWYQQDLVVNPHRYLIPDSDDIAPWARGQLKNDSSGIRSSIFRIYFFFWIIPLLTGVAAAELQSLEVLMVPIIILVAIGLISTLDKMLAHQPALLEIPGMGPALERVAEMRAYFWGHEPKVSRSFWTLFRNWKDFKPYWTLALIVAGTVVIDSVLSYNSNYEFIGLFPAVKIIGIAALIAAVVVLINLVSLTTLSFHYSLSGKRTRLRFMTLGAVAATILGFQIPSTHLPADVFSSEGKKTAFTKLHGGQLPSWISGERLDQRMKDPEFRQELIEKMDVFLWYYVNLDISEEELNKDFRNLLLGLAPNDEPDAFEIIEFADWAAVLYFDGSGSCSLIDEQLTDEAPESGEQSVKYSILAIVKKNTDDVMQANLDLMLTDPQYELTPILDIVKIVNNKSIFYQWANELEPFLGNRGQACKALICDNYGGCPWLTSGLQTP